MVLAKYYLNDPDMVEKIAKNGENYVLQNFSWDKIIKNYSEFFNKIQSKNLMDVFTVLATKSLHDISKNHCNIE